jgi:uncharacterized protein
MNLEWINDNTIYVTLHGSQAYGLANEFSDTDVKGICIPPQNVEYNLYHRFEQAENPKELEDCLTHLKNPKNPKLESSIFSLRKFFLLAAEVNPNIIELLWTDPKDHFVFKYPMDVIIENRNLFLSNKARYTFSGYAAAQAKKIERHRKWIVLGDVKPPSREEFGLPSIIPKGLEEVFGYIKSRVEQWNLNQYPLEEMQRSELKDTIWELITTITKREVSVANWPDVYADGIIFKMKEDFNLKDDVVAFINVERAYAKAKQVYDSWVSWKKERNPERRKLEEKCGYDCYSADTEFLTDSGWKHFDDITPQFKLATVNPTTQAVEYHKYLDKFDGTFNGQMYHFEGTHTDILVTPNHKMWVRPRERNTHTLHEWQFIESAHLPSGFNILRTIAPVSREYKKSHLPGLQYYLSTKNIKRHNLLRLVGWYVSEGCILVDGERKKGISISQLKGGRVHNHIAKCTSEDVKLTDVLHEYCYFRKEKNRHEMTWNIYDVQLAEWFSNACGRYSENKKLPRWVMSLSKREKEIILDSMMNGDGTKRPKDNSEIYYTSSKQLANDVQELSFLCGFETSMWGPYDGMYHVHINRTRTSEKEMTRRSIKKAPVTQHRIVCFTVPNHLLVTRRNGNIAIQGNSKHASHLVRLMRMGYEIITEGKVIVNRTGIDADELLSIKNGGWSFEKVMEFKDEMEVKLDSEYARQKQLIADGKPTPLPREVNKEELNKFYHDLYNTYWNK